MLLYNTWIVIKEKIESLDDIVCVDGVILLFKEQEKAQEWANEINRVSSQKYIPILLGHLDYRASSETFGIGSGVGTDTGTIFLNNANNTDNLTLTATSNSSRGAYCANI